MVNWFIKTFGWMYWTYQSATFFFIIFASIVFLTILQHSRPVKERKGFLPIETGRGDRLFIGILTTVAFFLLWLGFFGSIFLGVPSLISLGWFAVLFKWG